MTYVETHSIEIPPITLPVGVTVEVTVPVGAGGQQAVQIRGTTGTSKADTVSLLQEAFALLMTAASAEGVGQPIFGKDTIPPSAPSSLIASAVSATEVDLAWGASTDNTAVAEYEVIRGGVKIATVPATQTSYKDTSVTTGISYTYSVVAVDTSGNASAPSTASVVTTP